MKQLLTFLMLMAMTIPTSCAQQYAGAKKPPMHNINYAEGTYRWFASEKEQPAPTKAREGERVRIYFPLVATDTNYTFYIDGLQTFPDYTHETGYIIEFTMPDHDVVISYNERNTMLDFKIMNTEEQ